MVGFTVDGVHWYKTEAAEDAANPVWGEEADDADDPDEDGPDPCHFLLPLKELDLGLQVRPHRAPAVSSRGDAVRDPCRHRELRMRQHSGHSCYSVFRAARG